jgi:hypothetical protein
MEKDVCNCAKSNDTQGQGQIPGPGASESAKETAAVEETDGLPGVVRELGEYPPGTLITEGGLAKLLHRHPVSIRRAVLRGELPPGCRMLNATCWTVGAILAHIEARLAEARKAREAMLKKISALST